MSKVDIKNWQLFLIGQKFLKDVADGIWGRNTSDATKAFQKAYQLTADGVIGPKTLYIAALIGYKAAEYPAKPTNLRVMTSAERAKLFGTFKYERSHDLTDGDAIRILGDWEEKNIVLVDIPQLDRKMRFHRLAAPLFVNMFKEWEAAGLMKRILTYDGSFYPRFQRGSNQLSNHSWGTAMDINADYNGLNVTPKLLGQTGCVRELVEIANNNSIYWGGHFSRPDGMHFEIGLPK
jgi:hypothetical protein